MTEIITQLTTGVTSDLLFGTVSDVMPFVIKILPFVVGYRILRKVVKGTGKLKLNF